MRQLCLCLATSLGSGQIDLSGGVGEEALHLPLVRLGRVPPFRRLRDRCASLAFEQKVGALGSFLLVLNFSKSFLVVCVL